MAASDPTELLRNEFTLDLSEIEGKGFSFFMFDAQKDGVPVQVTFWVRTFIIDHPELFPDWPPSSTVKVLEKPFGRLPIEQIFRTFQFGSSLRKFVSLADSLNVTSFTGIIYISPRERKTYTIVIPPPDPYDD